MNNLTVNKVSEALKEFTTQLKNQNEWNLALSGGYDSNLLLHCIKQQKNEKPTQLFSIGGKEIDETTIAKEIVKSYSKCQLNCKKVDEDAFNEFSKLVWQLEGYLFQDGVFLQNALAQSVVKTKANYILLGEMADQLLNYLFYSKKVRRFEQSKPGSMLKIFYLFKISKKRSLKEVIGLIKLRNYLLSKTEKQKGKTTGFDVMFDYILKKNGLLLNSHGVQGLYPFLKTEIHNSINPQSIKNIQKKVFKRQVKNVLAPEIGNRLNKNGGTTDIYYLFEKHFNEMENAILQSPVIKNIFNLKRVGEILDNRKKNWHFIVQLYYVTLVEKLFTTSNFELKIKTEDFNIATTNTFKIIPPINNIAS